VGDGLLFRVSCQTPGSSSHVAEGPWQYLFHGCDRKHPWWLRLWGRFASAKFGLRAIAHAAARELGPLNIHVAHLVMDSSVDTEWVRQLIAQREGQQAIDNLDPNRLMRPSAVAEAYWQLYQQPREAWTFEHEMRPFGEKF
jgi:NAD(P)-dependent dehydrogenase (short-subunit alcohol dehydrogenase family)